MELDRETRESLSIAQKNEITEHIIYARLAEITSDTHNKGVLKNISGEELRHYGVLKGYLNSDAKPDRMKIFKYLSLSRIFGLTFGIKLMERGENRAGPAYEKLAREVPEAKNISEDENRHEKELVDLIDEERLKYTGSMVLGLNDALVEITGSLAGFTFAFRNTRVIAMAGLITGIAGALSMAAADYQSTKSEGHGKNPVKSAAYTGAAFVFAVLFLIFPYLVLSNLFFCMGFMILDAVLVLMLFTFYMSVIREIPFGKRFFEMTVISLGVAALTFTLGILVKKLLNVDI